MDSASTSGTAGLSEIEEKRLRRRAKNKAKKEESKRLREEEIRRKLYEPKNRRVRVVGRDELEAFRRPDNGRGSSLPILPTAVTSEDFPDLGSGKKGKKAKILLSVTENNDLSSPQAGRKAAENGSGVETGSGEQKCQTDKGESDSTVKNATVKRKRADPMEIDLFAALKKQSAATEKKAPPAAGPKKKTSSQLHGNQLDSSRPERKKGKTREIPKPQKPTHLKAVILQDRKVREAQGRSQQEHDASGNEESIEDLPRKLVTDQVEEEEKVSESQAELEVSGVLETVVSLVGCQRQPEVCSASADDFNEGSVSPDEILKQMSTLQVDEREAPRRPIHGRKFRDYCDHAPSKELDAAVTALLTDIVRFQDRLYFTDPVKAHAKRRFVLGFRETKKYLALKKLKLVVVAPDLEAAPSKGGIEDTVAELKELSRSQGIPCVFSVKRSVLRRLTHKSYKVRGISCIGIMNYEGSQENFHTIQSLLPDLRSRYQSLMSETEGSHSSSIPVPTTETPDELSETEEESMDINKQVVATFLVKLAKELETM